ncbi:MAG: photosystem I reaction center subunit PsaK [Microcoleaceae cyanobacterium]
MSQILLAAVATTPAWSPKVAIIMAICNILALVIGRSVIKQPNVGPSPRLFFGMSLAAFIGSMCLGHIIAAGAILGLANVGGL